MITFPAGYTLSTFWRRLFALFLLPHAAFALLAYPTAAHSLIVLLNGVLVALSAGVSVAFLPAIFSIFFKPGPLDRGDYLSFGIWLTWLASVMQATWAIAWRIDGMPMWMASTDFTSYYLWMRMLGGVFHLAAPGAIDDRIPPRRWIFIGILIAIAVAVVLLFSFMVDVFAVRDIWVRIA